MIGSSHPVVHVWLQALADTALFKKNEYFFSEYSRIKKINNFWMNILDLKEMEYGIESLFGQIQWKK